MNIKIEGLRSRLHKALKTWNKLDSTNSKIFSDLQLSSKFDSVDNFLDEGIVNLAKKNELEAKILRLRFEKNKSIVSVAHELNFSPDQINRIQRNAIELFSEMIVQNEKRIREEMATYFINCLPIKESEKLFGFREVIDKVAETVLQISGPAIVAITGLGGIGKTSLADAVTRQAMTNYFFQKIIWYRVEKGQSDRSGIDGILEYLASQILPANSPKEEYINQLKLRFSSSPHLVVIDNIDNSVDLKDIIGKLIAICGISKFIITSRINPPNISQVCTFRLDEINIEEAGKLLAFQAIFIGLEEYSKEITENLDVIYSIVGGNPLALKLLVGLLDALPLSVVLEDFENAKLQDIKSMYHHIYLLAWHVLENASKQLLVGMLQASSSGVSLKNMTAWSGLKEIELANAIQSLFNRSLLERRGGLEDRRYGIHRLTHSFLETDIVKWPPN